MIIRAVRGRRGIAVRAAERLVKSLITPIAIAYIVAGAFSALSAFFLLLYALFPAFVGVAAVAGAVDGDEGAAPAAVMMAISTIGLGGLGLAFGLLAIGYIADGYGLVKRRRWSRKLGIVLAVPMLGLCMPIGTLFGALAIVAFLSSDVTAELTT